MTGLLAAIAAHARRQPSAPALSDGARTLPWHDLPREIERVALQIRSSCPAPGPVAFIVPNGRPWVILDLALRRLGRTAVPLPTFFLPGQITQALDRSGCAYLLSIRSPASAATRALSVLGTAVAVTAIKTERDKDSHRPPPAGTARIVYRPDQGGVLQGICLSQQTLDSVAASVIDRLGPEYLRLHCALLPLPILIETVAGLYATLMAGGEYRVPPPRAVGLEEPFLPVFSRLVEALAANGATTTILVPRLLRGAIAVIKRTGPMLPGLEMLPVGGAPLGPDLYREARSLSLPIVQAYGFEEAGSLAAIDCPLDNGPGLVGRPLPHARVERGSAGELVIRDPQFLGYLGGEPRTRSFATGDLGDIDAAGRIHVSAHGVRRLPPGPQGDRRA